MEWVSNKSFAMFESFNNAAVARYEHITGAPSKEEDMKNVGRKPEADDAVVAMLGYGMAYVADAVGKRLEEVGARFANRASNAHAAGLRMDGGIYVDELAMNVAKDEGNGILLGRIGVDKCCARQQPVEFVGNTLERVRMPNHGLGATIDAGLGLRRLGLVGGAGAIGAVRTDDDQKAGSE